MFSRTYVELKRISLGSGATFFCTLSSVESSERYHRAGGVPCCFPVKSRVHRRQTKTSDILPRVANCIEICALHYQLLTRKGEAVTR